MPVKPIEFLGDSLSRLRDFPAGAKQDAGYQLDRVQHGLQSAFEPMPFIGKGVEQIRIWDESGTYGSSMRLAWPMRSMSSTPSRRDPGHIETGYRTGEATFRPTDQETVMSKAKNERFASAWDALANTTEEAANLKVRSELARKIASLIQEHGWTQAAAADHCSVTQPRINDLLRGRISRFSLDALVNIAAALGQDVLVELRAA